ncbi:MAG TPA: nicotinate-nucleotide adenylyltransferase [Bacteroidetes bacterium]|nr:nicotinate-nucleotide adenylyltransferase [Bacteroidota bacterium]
MKTGLFFGSFNPVHIGHTAIANYFLEYAGLKQIWFVVSPHNPLKKRASLLPEYHRLELVNLALDNDPRIRATDIEFRLPKPSYTIDTLAYLSEKYPQREFVLIMGTDNLVTLYKWKNFEHLVRNYEIIVYPRKGSENQQLHPSVEKLLPEARITVSQAPLIEISSSFLRQAIGKGKNMRFFFREKVWEYIRDMHFYES